MELLIFYPLAGLCVLFALGVVINNSPINSAISLIGMMLGLAGVFVLLQAHFIAILQIIIYAGAIMVLFMFVIMLLNLKDKGEDEKWRSRDKNILLINSESESEINQIEKISKIKKKKIDIGVRLNPNIDSKTLKKISTGKKEDKFGLTEINFLKAINKFKNSKYLNIRCLSVHIGSQITDHKPYAKMLKVIGSVIKKSNHNFDFVDLGGGMGIKYNKETKKLDYKKYNSIIKNFLKKYRTKIIFEPGRSIIGDTALLLTRVLYIKKTSKINFVILDAAMNDLMRPALYGSRHEIMASIKSKKMIRKKHEFVGPICETTDKFLSVPKFQTLREKDILAICDVGAYGMVLSSNYNLRTKPSEILINQSSSKIITKRQKLNNII